MNPPNKITFPKSRAGIVAGHLYAANQAETIAQAMDMACTILKTNKRFKVTTNPKSLMKLCLKLIPSKAPEPTYEQELASYGHAFHSIREQYRHGRVCQHGEGSARVEVQLEPCFVRGDDFASRSAVNGCAHPDDTGSKYQPIPEILIIKQYLLEKHRRK